MVTRVGRDTATVLFTDLVDSTAMRAALGDDRADEIRRDHDTLLRAAMAEHRGNVVKTLGDGLLATFDSASDAVGAAVAAQHAVTARNRRAPRDDALSVRIGLSAGDVVWEDDDCFGTPVVEAKRLCDLAEGGSIVVAEVVRLLAGSRGGHGFEPLGPFDLKGLAVAVSAYRVPVPAGAGGPGHGIMLPAPLAPGGQGSVAFVGRGPERGVLHDAWKEVVAEGHRRVTLIAGEPGVGKTRLAAELAQTAYDDAAIVAFGRCDEDLAVAYQPWVEAINTLVTESSDGDVARWCATFGGDLARLVPLVADRVPGLPAPLGAEPDTERLRLFEAVVAFFAAVGETVPVLFVLDDLHWADKGSLLMLRHVVRATKPLPMLIVGTYRDTDLDRAHPLADVLADLRRNDRMAGWAPHGARSSARRARRFSLGHVVSVRTPRPGVSLPALGEPSLPAAQGQSASVGATICSESCATRVRSHHCVDRGITPGPYTPRPTRTTRPFRTSHRSASETALLGRPGTENPEAATQESSSSRVSEPPPSKSRSVST